MSEWPKELDSKSSRWVTASWVRIPPSPPLILGEDSQPHDEYAVLKTFKDFSSLTFDDRFVRSLPADPDTGTQVRLVRNACYSFVRPTPVREPELFAWSSDLASSLGIQPPTTADRSLIAEVFGGHRLMAGMRPYAACYGGHQFGNWAGQLGDGRAITLGELIDPHGSAWEIQLKGAGPTPYSRRGDGRAVLRSSIREFLCSEAMHALGVPTTRALSLVTSRETIARDMFYDGRVAWEPCAIVTRVAPHFIRFGHFEILAARKEPELMRKLADYAIASSHPELDLKDPHVIAQWFHIICERTASMIAHWMRVGFVHGVMNTDNMSVLGLTIDYGPYGWLDIYDPQWTPNTTDAGQRRYRFAQQPSVALWNLECLAHALRSIAPDPELLEAGLDRYREAFQESYSESMAAKLGLKVLAGPQDQQLLQTLEQALCATEMDMTLFYRGLIQVSAEPGPLEAEAELDQIWGAAFYQEQRSEAATAALLGFLCSYRQRLTSDPLTLQERAERMRTANPKYVLRNYLSQLAIDAAHQGDASVCERLLAVMRQPYDEQPEAKDLAVRRPEWARHKAGCSALSCSS